MSIGNLDNLPPRAFSDATGYLVSDECQCARCHSPSVNFHPLEARDPTPIDQSIATFRYVVEQAVIDTSTYCTSDGAANCRCWSKSARRSDCPADVESPPLVPTGFCTPDGEMYCMSVGNSRQCATCPGWVVPPRPRQLIAFTGLAGSGKSTAALHLVNAHGFTRTRFAGPLKAMMTALGLSHAEIEGHLKERPCALLGGRTPRFAMQTIGTEWGRMTIDEDMWTNAWRAALPAAGGVVVDDCRFDNEAAAVKAAGGFIVRIVRPGAGAGAAGHSSEGQDLPWTTEIVNDGSVDEFLAKVDAAVRDLTGTA